MDSTDKQIVKILREDARKPVTVIATILGLSRLTVQKRIRALEERDVISGYTIRTGSGYVAEKFRAQVLLGIAGMSCDHLTVFFKSIPEIVTIHSLAGRFDAILTVEAESSEAIDRVLVQIRQHPNVERTESCLLLSTKLDRQAKV